MPIDSAGSAVEAVDAAPAAAARRGPFAWYGRLSFRAKLVLMSTATSLFCLLLVSATLVAIEMQELRQLLVQRASTLADVVAANSEAALSFDDRAGATQILANLAPEPSVDAARILRPGDGPHGLDAEPFAEFRRSGVDDLPDTHDPRVESRFVGTRLEIVRPITQGDATLGWIWLRVHLAQLSDMLDRIVLVVGGLLLLAAPLAWLLSYWLQRSITRPVTELLKTATAVRTHKDYSVRAEVLGADELGALTQGVNAMLDEVQAHDAARAQVEAEIRRLNEDLEQKVRMRTQDLQASNLDLQEAVEVLRRTQTQLVESEKMAALGGLVAGVAHEINTPLGICVTVSSALGDRIQELEQAYKRGLRRGDLEAFFEHGRQAMDLMATNLARSADLVRSFKLVAVDQSSEERRRFRAGEYLHEVLVSLGPRLKRSHVDVRLECDPEIELNSFPGVLAQIVTNLTMNALIHAFTPGERGRIEITGRAEGNDFLLDFRDDGVGMAEDVRQRVFDPFFTTKRGAGGSGLGLHITYNQVTQQLAGSIRCESAPGRGTTLHLRFPRKTPERPGRAEK